MITFGLSGAAVSLLRDCGNWPIDCPSGWAAITASPKRKYGHGYQHTVTMTRADATDLADYLDSVIGVNAGMSASERDGGREGSVAAKALATIETALHVSEEAP